MLVGRLSGGIGEADEVAGAKRTVGGGRRNKVVRGVAENRNKKEHGEKDGLVRRSPLARTLNWNHSHDWRALVLTATATATV